MKRGIILELFLFVISLNFASAEVFNLGDLEKYSLLFYLSIGVLVVLILILIFFLVRKKKLIVSISGAEVGGIIEIEIIPGRNGIGNTIELFEEDGTKIGSLQLCQEQICKDKKILKYRVPLSWKVGKYNLSVYDYQDDRWKEFEFSIS